MEIYKCPVVPLQVTQLKFSSVDVYLDQILGEGTYSTSYRAKCDQLPCVAKAMKTDGASEDEVMSMEIACQLLSAIKHPNIVQCFGTARQGFENRPIILLEEMEESLSQFLERRCAEKAKLPYYVKVNVLCDVALGLAYLHYIECVHGNLTGNNVLIVGESRAKITDFWVLKVINMHPVLQSSNIDPRKMIYMAPETRHQPPVVFTQYSDAYSFGVIAVQVDTQEIPTSEPRKSVTSKMKPDSSFLKLANECLELDPSARPGLERLCKDLASLKTGDNFITNKEKSRGECENLRRHLLAHRSELRTRDLQLQGKSEEADSLKTIITKLEQKVLDISKENKKLEQTNAEHEVFEWHLIHSDTSSGYQSKLHSTDEPDSTSDAMLHTSFSEIHQDLQFGEIIELNDVQLEDSILAREDAITITNGSWNHNKIAFKKYNFAIGTQSDLEEWRQKLQYEVGILGKLSHPNLVQIYGAVVEFGCVGLVLEHMQCSLCQVVFHEEQFRDTKKRRIVRQVCDGLAFLHCHSVVHCNLTTANIYLSHQHNIAKIGNYGPKTMTSKFKTIASELVAGADKRYAAPEILHKSHEQPLELFKKSDVFSLAVVTYEVMTGLKYGGCLTSCNNLPRSMHGILSICWEEDPNKRPTVDQFRTKWNEV